MDAGKSIVAITDSAVFSRLDDSSGVVLELGRKRYYMLSETGTAIVEMLCEAAPDAVEEEEIVDALFDDFDLDRDTLARDVAKYLKELERRRVVTLSSLGDQPEEFNSESIEITLTGF